MCCSLSRYRTPVASGYKGGRINTLKNIEAAKHNIKVDIVTQNSKMTYWHETHLDSLNIHSRNTKDVCKFVN